MPLVNLITCTDLKKRHEASVSEIETLQRSTAQTMLVKSIKQSKVTMQYSTIVAPADAAGDQIEAHPGNILRQRYCGSDTHGMCKFDLRLACASTAGIYRLCPDDCRNKAISLQSRAQQTLMDQDGPKEAYCSAAPKCCK